jgi:hypothetical protein
MPELTPGGGFPPPTKCRFFVPGYDGRYPREMSQKIDDSKDQRPHCHSRPPRRHTCVLGPSPANAIGSVADAMVALFGSPAAPRPCVADAAFRVATERLRCLLPILRPPSDDTNGVFAHDDHHLCTRRRLPLPSRWTRIAPQTPDLSGQSLPSPRCS